MLLHVIYVLGRVVGQCVLTSSAIIFSLWISNIEKSVFEPFGYSFGDMILLQKEHLYLATIS